MARVCNIVLVCEGKRDSSFARGFLERSGNWRILDRRTQRGSGHGWVRSQFVKEVAALVRFSEGRGVLGLLDEDGQGASVREKEIEDALRAQNLGSLSASEGRCLLLPTRNLETWLYWLKGRQSETIVSIDEKTDFKRRSPIGIAPIDDWDCRPVGQYFHTLDHTRLPEGCPSMLCKGLAQLRNFVNAVRR
jgi:5S rRNA maturation endonuclease (ribonuclease M5)